MRGVSTPGCHLPEVVAQQIGSLDHLQALALTRGKAIPPRNAKRTYSRFLGAQPEERVVSSRHSLSLTSRRGVA